MLTTERETAGEQGPVMRNSEPPAHARARRKSEAAAVRTHALVRLDRITRTDDFTFRRKRLDRHHKADLAGHIRGTGKPLDPVLLWRDASAEDGDAAPLVLLDGAHRIAAYKTANWSEPVPAIVLTCDRRAALLAALGHNARHVLPLSQMERMDAAWRLVRETVEPPYTRAEIVGLAAVSKRTVNYMRRRWAEMRAADEEPCGEWFRDRSGRVNDYEMALDMTDAQRHREIEALATDIRDVLDRRKRPEKAILVDSYAVNEAIVTALGDPRFKQIAEWFVGGRDNLDEWVADVNEWDDADDGDDEDAPF